jgi:hypothetical protein
MKEAQNSSKEKHHRLLLYRRVMAVIGGGKSFTVTISKEGYETQVIPIESSANGWYIGGNFIFGGLIGWFIIDPLNGGMYTLSPEEVSAGLGEKTTHNNTATDGSISILLIQDVSLPLISKIEKIN